MLLKYVVLPLPLLLLRLIFAHFSLSALFADFSPAHAVVVEDDFRCCGGMTVDLFVLIFGVIFLNGLLFRWGVSGDKLPARPDSILRGDFEQF